MLTFLLCVAIAATILGALQLLHDLVQERRVEGLPVSPALAVGAHPATIAVTGTATATALLCTGLFVGIGVSPLW